MKLGINLLCFTGFVTRADLTTIEEIKNAGFDGVEIPIFSGEVEHYAWLGKQLDHLGLARTSVAVIPDETMSPISTNSDARARGQAHLEWVLECAVALGAVSIGGPFYSPVGYFTGNQRSKEEWGHGIEAHRKMAEAASDSGIFLSLEPLNRFETYFLNTMADARAYADEVNHPAFRINYDSFHANIEEHDPIAAFRTVAPHAGVIHISENDRGIPGTGHIAFADLFRAIKEEGHDDWLVIEAFGRTVPELAAATRVWRDLFPDLSTLFKQGGEFVRHLWDEIKV